MNKMLYIYILNDWIFKIIKMNLNKIYKYIRKMGGNSEVIVIN